MRLNQSQYVNFPPKKTPIDSQSGSVDSKNLQICILLFGYLEFVLGVFSYIATDYVQILTPLTFAAAALAAISLVFFVWQPASIKVYDVLAGALMLAYGIGTLNTLFAYMQESQTLLMTYYLSDEWLTRGLASCLGSAGLLHIVGRVDKQGYIFRHFEISESGFKKILITSLVSSFLLVVQVLKGGIGYQGVQQGLGQQISATASIVLTTVIPVGSLAIYAALRDSNAKRKMGLLALALFFLAIQFMIGRRTFVFSSIIFLMTAIFSRRPKNFLSIKNLILMILMIVTIQIATTATYSLRLATWSLGNIAGGKPNLGQLSAEVYRMYLKGEMADIGYKMGENVTGRTFVLEYFASLSEAESKKDPLYGLNIARAFISATPSLIYPGKFQNKLFASEEQIANPYFGLPNIDLANSILTASVIDWGLFGVLLMPSIVCIIFSFTMRLRDFKHSAITAYIIGVMGCQMMITVETDVTSYIIGIRDILIIFGVTKAIIFAVNLFKKPRPYVFKARNFQQ